MELLTQHSSYRHLLNVSCVPSPQSDTLISQVKTLRLQGPKGIIQGLLGAEPGPKAKSSNSVLCTLYKALFFSHLLRSDTESLDSTRE